MRPDRDLVCLLGKLRGDVRYRFVIDMAWFQ